MYVPLLQCTHGVGVLVPAAQSKFFWILYPYLGFAAGDVVKDVGGSITI